jgi:protein-S-isoprenylcysteine O-methyltransferase Ste14
MDFFVIGFSFVYPTIFFFVFTIITILCIHCQIIKEEDFLNQQYGAEYQAYKAKVRRYL